MTGTVEREDDLDDEAFQIRHVFAVYGRAAYLVQVLEHGLVNALTVIDTSLDPAGTRDRFDAYMEGNFRRTMGTLVRHLKPHLDDDDSLLDDLATALDRRNYLIHHFFREHAGDFASFSGRELMLAELLVTADQFEAVDARITPVVDRFLEARGVDADTRERLVREQYEALKREARTADG